QPDDIDGSYLLDALGQQVNFGADQIRDLKRLLAWQNLDLDRTLGGDLLVELHDDLLRQLIGEVAQLEVQSALVGVHVAAGHGSLIIAPDHPAKQVERRMCTHQLVAARPVDRPVDRLTDHWHALTLQRVPDMVALLADLSHLPGTTSGAERTGVVRLAAAR